MGSLSGWRLLVLSLALVGLLARHTSGQAVVMTDPNSTCSEVCGSEGCPCPDLESAFAQASEAAVNGTIVTIELAPGVYVPSSTLAFTSACFQLIGTDGSQSTSIEVPLPYSLFSFEACSNVTSALVQGVEIVSGQEEDSSVSRSPELQLQENAAVVLTDVLQTNGESFGFAHVGQGATLDVNGSTFSDVAVYFTAFIKGEASSSLSFSDTKFMRIEGISDAETQNATSLIYTAGEAWFSGGSMIDCSTSILTSVTGGSFSMDSSAVNGCSCDEACFEFYWNTVVFTDTDFMLVTGGYLIDGQGSNLTMVRGSLSQGMFSSVINLKGYGSGSLNMEDVFASGASMRSLLSVSDASLSVLGVQVIGISLQQGSGGVFDYNTVARTTGLSCVIQGCTFLQTGGDYGVTAILKLDPQGTVTPFEVSDCHFDGSGAAAISMLTAAASNSQLSVLRCQFNSFITTAVKLASAAVMEDCIFNEGQTTALIASGDFQGRNITIEWSIAQDLSPMVVDGYQAEVSVVDSYFGNNFCLGDGAAVTVSATRSHTVFSNCTFIGNQSGGHGGAVAVQEGEHSNTTFVDCTFHFNRAAMSGGTITVGVAGTASVQYSTINDTTALVGGAFSVRDDGRLMFKDVDVSQGSASSGGCGFVSSTSEIPLVFDRLTLSNCVSEGDGGGVEIRDGATLQMKDCTIRNCTGNNGGGISVTTTSNGIPLIQNCYIYDNKALSTGGAIYLGDEAALAVVDSYLEGNTADSWGGGILVEDYSHLILNGTAVRLNRAPNGAGIQGNDDAVLLIDSCLIELNAASASGGGLAFNIRATGLLTNTTIRRNYAHSKGGGIAVYNTADPFFFDSVIESNNAVSGGGAWFTDCSKPTFIRTRFLENVAVSQAGAVLASDYANSTFVSCTVANNTAQSGSGGGLLVEDFTNTTILSTDFLGNHATNGGALWTTASLGPFIFACNFLHNTVTVDGGAVVLAQNSSALMQECTCAFNSAGGNAGCLQVLDLATPNFTDMTIQHNTAGIEGGGVYFGDQSRPNMYGGNFPFVIMHNTAALGGGMAIVGGSAPNVHNAIIRGNYATSMGGGLYATSGSGKLSNVVMNDNHSPSGGGIALANGQTELESTLCRNCSIYDNYAGNGGGIFLQSQTSILDQYQNATVFTFEELSLVGNNATHGGAVYFDGVASRPLFGPGCSFEHNIATLYGGGVSFSISSRTLTPWILEGNFSGNGARYAGYNVGWVTNPEYPLLFCQNCTFGEQDPGSPGYANDAGAATDPRALHFITSCPSSTLLSDEKFQISVLLTDSFSTPVTGPIVTDENFVVNISVFEDECDLLGSVTQLPIDPTTGIVTFTGLYLRGKNATTCKIDVEVSSDVLTSTGIPVIECATLLDGCPESEEISSQGSYDTCVEVSPKWSLNVTALLLTMVLLLLCILIAILAGAAIAYGIYRKRKLKEYELAHTEIPDLMRAKTMCLEDILNDPNIPRIPTEELTLGKRLGVGASGVVSEALWVHTDDFGNETMVECAVKELLYADELMLNSVAMEEFILEIKLLSALVHANIVRLLGVSVTDNTLYLVTELMHRGSLRDVLDSKGVNLPWSMRLKLAKDAAKGISYLHQRNVIHRDLKPQNLLVNTSWECKVADFGVSTIKTCTRTMTCIGTPMYMAPEVLTKNKSSEKSDVYSFGIILVELYTGYRPYTQRYGHLNQAALMWEIIQNGVRPDTSSLPGPLLQLVLDTWNPEPQLRPTFPEILMRLRRLEELELPPQPAEMQGSDVSSVTGVLTSASESDSMAQFPVVYDSLTDASEADALLEPNYGEMLDGDSDHPASTSAIN